MSKETTNEKGKEEKRVEKKQTSHVFWLHNRGLLLILIASFSLLLFFSCLLFVKGEGSGGEALLRGCAVLLSLAMPSFFYLRSAGNEHAFVFGKLPPLRALPRVLLFGLGAFALGLLFGTLGTKDGGLFSVFAYPTAFSVSSLASLLAYAFGTAFLPFGLLASHLSESGRLGILLPVASLYAAFAFSLTGSALMLLFGLLLSLLYLAYRSFFSVLGVNAAFLLGGYVGVLLPDTGASPLVLSILLAALAAALLFGSLDYAALRRAVRELPSGKDTKKWVLWALFGVLALVSSLLLSLFVLENIG